MTSAPSNPARGPRRLIPAFPWPHFMALAPLDVWARLLVAAKFRVPPRYWPRLAFTLFTSTIATAVTLPERSALAPVWRWRRRRARGARAKNPVRVVVVLGYYRSGTTHLHYLLCCDRRFVTPRWSQALIPQGFSLSWTFARYFLVPFLASSRPQDDVAYGPEWPTEDDFALCNWGLASSLPGRMVVSDVADDFERWHALEGLSTREKSRWAALQWAVAWKTRAAARLASGFGGPAGSEPAMVLLKSPSHTARVRALIEVFGEENVRFVHLSRDPASVLRSNIAMHKRFDTFRLQDAPHTDDVRERIIAEYDATERAFLRDAAHLPPERLVRVRFQDLIADPMGEMRRIYDGWGLPWTADLEGRAAEYLDSVREYRTAGQKQGRAPQHSEPLPTRLEWMGEAFGHTRPTVPKRDPPRPASAARSRTDAVLALAAASVGALGGWLAAAFMLRDRLDVLAWPAGVWIGLAACRAARRGTRRLGLAAAAATLLVMLAVSFPATWWAFYAAPGRGGRTMETPWLHVWYSTRDGLLAWNNALWVFLGVVSAYRFASRAQPRPPGD